MNEAGRYILIVDDNLNNLEVTAKILKDEGYRISLAQDGPSALSQLEGMIPDLILLDIMMPVMDGLELCRKIKKDNRMSDVPVIFLTAKSQTEDLEAGFAAGGVDYVTKPFRREELLVRIKNHLELAASRKWIIEMNKSRDKLYSIIAHDIRSPLSSISMAVKSIADGYLKPETPDYKEIIDYLNQTSGLTLSMLDNLLSYTHNNGSSSELFPARMNLCTVVLDCVTLLKGNAENKKIDIIIDTPEEVMAYFDELSMHAVFRNIIINAIKFTPEYGKVMITVNSGDEFALVAVSDTGIGIPEEVVNKIFVSNEHFTSLGTNKEKGSGLGTFIIRDFVRKNGGMIEVKSKPKEGTMVKVSLPMYRTK